MKTIREKIGPKLANALDRESAESMITLQVMLDKNAGTNALNEVEVLMEPLGEGGKVEILPSMNVIFGRTHLKNIKQIAEKSSVEWLDAEGYPAAIKEVID
jgi:hypothetical protein